MTKHLTPEQRRRQFLDVTGRLFVRDGLAGITMIAVADEAGVSRRLLYDHFPDLRTLLRDYVWDALSRQLSMSQVPDSGEAAGPTEAVRRTFDEMLLLGDEQRAIIELIRERPSAPDFALVWEVVEANLSARWGRFAPFAGLPSATLVVIGRVMLGTMLELTGAVRDGVLDHDTAIEAAVAVGTGLARSIGNQI